MPIIAGSVQRFRDGSDGADGEAGSIVPGKTSLETKAVRWSV
jgi:hypothetical protein